MGKTTSVPKTLLADATGNVLTQTPVDQTVLQQQTENTDVASCKTQTFSSGDLYT